MGHDTEEGRVGVGAWGELLRLHTRHRGGRHQRGERNLTPQEGVHCVKEVKVSVFVAKDNLPLHGDVLVGDGRATGKGDPHPKAQKSTEGGSEDLRWDNGRNGLWSPVSGQGPRGVWSQVSSCPSYHKQA